MCICTCTHESAEPTQPYESPAASAEDRKENLLWLSGGCNRKEIQRVQGTNLFPAVQHLYFDGWFKIFSPFPLPASIDPRLDSHTPRLLSEVEPPTLLPGSPVVPTTADFAQQCNVPVLSNMLQWWSNACSFMLCRVLYFLVKTGGRQQEVIVVQNIPLRKTLLTCSNCSAFQDVGEQPSLVTFMPEFT